MPMVRLGDTEPTVPTTDKRLHYNGIYTDPSQCRDGAVVKPFRTEDLPSGKRYELAQLIGPNMPEVLYMCEMPMHEPTGPVYHTIQSGPGDSPSAASPLPRWILIGGLAVAALWLFSGGKGN